MDEIRDTEPGEKLVALAEPDNGPEYWDQMRLQIAAAAAERQPRAGLGRRRGSGPRTIGSADMGLSQAPSWLFTHDIKIVGAGWIETTGGSPVPPPEMSGTYTSGNWTPVVGIATTVRTAYDGSGLWIFDLQQSDPRVGGRLEGGVGEIGSARPDGRIDYYASNTLSNQEGAWKTLVSADPMVRGPAPGYEDFQ